jgi:exosome complex component RRP45
MASNDLGNISDEAQRLLSNRILRSLERSLLIGGALDTEALCVQSGVWVWRLQVNVTVLDDNGNILDASVLAAVAALRHYRKPQVEHSQQGSPTLIHSDLREPTPLPLHHTPLSISFALVHADDASLATSSSTSTVAALVDPTDREELVQTGCISLAMNVHCEVCLLDFGGGCELQPKQLKQCWKLAETSILQLCRMLEETLRQADEKAQQERLQRLQQQGDEQLPPPSVSEGVPFVQDSSNYDFMDVDTSTEWKDVSGDVESAAAQVTNQEEESYRLKALDYALGHVAAKVKDVSSTSTKSSSTNDNDKSKKAGSLLQAMLRSAQSAHISSSSDVAVDETKDVVMTNDAKGDLRSQEAQDEFEQFAKKAGSKQKQKHAASDAMDSDDDEEETTTVLESEFQSVPKPNSVRSKKMAQSNGPPKAMGNDDDDDIDDLAMAIKSKKKKKSKKSKN